MIQAIGAIFIAIWFYRVARINGKSGLKWLFIGLTVYFLPSILWVIFCKLVIMPSIMSSILDTYWGSWEDIIPILIGLGIGLVGLTLGIAAAVLVRCKFLPKRKPLRVELSPEEIVIWIKSHRQLTLRASSIISIITGGLMIICGIADLLNIGEIDNDIIRRLVLGIIFFALGVYLFIKECRKY